MNNCAQYPKLPAIGYAEQSINHTYRNLFICDPDALL